MSAHSIPKGELGRGGPLLPRIGLGCMSMTPDFYGDVEEADAVNTLRRSIELGTTFWDTSNFYGAFVDDRKNGYNEKFISKVLRDHRDKVFICTKFGVSVTPDGALSVNGSPDYVRQCCEESLNHLGVDVIDLYYQHRIDLNVPVEETVAAMAELVKEGKVRYIGLSECSPSTLRRAHKVHPISAVQMEYSPWTLDIETNGLLDTCRELGVAVVAYSPLGRGFLTGAFRKPEDLPEGDWRRGNPRFQAENFEKNLELADVFQQLAEKKGCTSSQLCLAWILAQGPDIFVIPGTKRVKHLELNAAAGSVQITPEDNAEIRKRIDSIPVVGSRYLEVDLSYMDSEQNKSTV